VKKILFLSIFLTQLTACSPEVGSDEWCKNLESKEKGEWTANELSDFTKHCLFN
jgi:hypothetical protein